MKWFATSVGVMCFSLAAYAAENPAVDMMVSMAKQRGDIQRMAACVKKPEAEVESAFQKSLDSCLKKFGMTESNEQKMNACFKKSINNSKSNLTYFSAFVIPGLYTYFKNWT